DEIAQLAHNDLAELIFASVVPHAPPPVQVYSPAKITRLVDAGAPWLEPSIPALHLLSKTPGTCPTSKAHAEMSASFPRVDAKDVGVEHTPRPWLHRLLPSRSTRRPRHAPGCRSRRCRRPPARCSLQERYHTRSPEQPRARRPCRDAAIESGR